MKELRFYVIYLTLLATIVGLIYYRKLPNKKAKLLWVLILLSFLAEFVGRNFFDWFGLKNYIVFNLYDLITFSGYIIILGLLLKKTVNKRIANGLLLLVNSSFIINMVYFQDIFNGMLTTFFTVACTSVFLLSSLYFVEMFSSNKASHYKKSIYFWHIVGILIFYIPFLPYLIASKMFLFNEELMPTFSVAIFGLNVLMYSSFIIGFIWSQKKYNY